MHEGDVKATFLVVVWSTRLPAQFEPSLASDNPLGHSAFRQVQRTTTVPIKFDQPVVSEIRMVACCAAFGLRVTAVSKSSAKSTLGAAPAVVACAVLLMASRAHAEPPRDGPINYVNTSHFLQYGVSFVSENVVSAGDICPSNEHVPCIIGSGF
jgi:hypothetical protein